MQLHELTDAAGFEDHRLVAQLRTIDERHRGQVETVAVADRCFPERLPPRVNGRRRVVLHRQRVINPFGLLHEALSGKTHGHGQ